MVALSLSNVLLPAAFWICSMAANFENLLPNEMRCSGVYAQDKFPSGKQAYINISIHAVLSNDAEKGKSTGHMAIAFTDFKDLDRLGVPFSNDILGKHKYICDDEMVESKMCSESNLGHYIVRNDDNQTLSIQTEYLEINEANNFSVQALYNVNATGFICVTADIVALDSDGKVVDDGPFSGFTGLIEWSNPYGKLPGSEYPKLWFYGILSLIYFFIGLIWVGLCFRYWADILPVQNYVSGVLLFLIVEMVANYGYLDQYNTTGKSSYLLLVLVVFLDAGRNSLCFFILLIVSLGYGVIKPTLGSTMLRCQLLTLIHFLCGCLYGAGAMLTNPDRVDSYILFFVLPLSISMTIFYVWIMQGMSNTIHTLESRQQHIKLQMYKHLRYAILGSIGILLLYFIASGLFFQKSSDSAFINDQWQNRWFLTDGWLSVLFLTIFTAIMFLWRPTSNNQKYGLQELAGDEETADALDLEARNQAESQPTQADIESGKILPPHLAGGVNIFDIGGDDDDDDKPSAHGTPGPPPSY